MRPTILFVLPWSPDSIGGVSEVVINIFRTFETRAHLRPRLLVESYGCTSFERSATRTLGLVDRFYLPSPAAPGKGLRHALAFAVRLPVALTRLVRYLRRENVRAINVHFPSLSAVSVVLARLIADRSLRIVLSFHGSELNAVYAAGPVSRYIWHGMMARCDAVVACSAALAADVKACFPRAAGRLHVVYNGVDAAACRAAGRPDLLPADLQGRRFLACIATFEHKKGQDVLIESFREVARSFPDLRLALVGASGPTLAKLQASVADDELRRRVHFFCDLPHEQALSVIAAAELFVLPSRREPFGIVILEAASLGVPVIASRVGGVPEIVEDGSSGVLVPPDDRAALAEAICGLLRDPERARALAARLRAVAETRFTWQQAADRYEALFSPTSRGRGRRPRSADRPGDDAPHSAR